MNAHMKRMAAAAVAALAWTSGAAHDATAAVKPQKMFALSSVNFRSPDGRTPKNTINFYDVTNIGPGGPTSGVFNNDPLFSIFIGFDYVQSFGSLGQAQGSEEDISAFTNNPVNGTIYAFS